MTNTKKRNLILSLTLILVFTIGAVLAGVFAHSATASADEEVKESVTLENELEEKTEEKKELDLDDQEEKKELEEKEESKEENAAKGGLSEELSIVATRSATTTAPGSVTTFTLTVAEASTLGFQNLTGVTLINWGDGTESDVTSVSHPGHNYTAGEYTGFIYGADVAFGIAAFYHCREVLTSVSLADNVTDLTTMLFAYCTELSEITIPASVRNIYGNSFHDSGITEIKFLSSSPASINDWFSNDPICYVPSNCASAYRSASVWSDHSAKILTFNKIETLQTADLPAITNYGVYAELGHSNELTKAPYVVGRYIICPTADIVFSFSLGINFVMVQDGYMQVSFNDDVVYFSPIENNEIKQAIATKTGLTVGELFYFPENIYLGAGVVHFILNQVANTIQGASGVNIYLPLEESAYEETTYTYTYVGFPTNGQGEDPTSETPANGNTNDVLEWIKDKTDAVSNWIKDNTGVSVSGGLITGAGLIILLYFIFRRRR